MSRQSIKEEAGTCPACGAPRDSSAPPRQNYKQPRRPATRSSHAQPATRPAPRCPAVPLSRGSAPRAARRSPYYRQSLSPRTCAGIAQPAGAPGPRPPAPPPPTVDCTAAQLLIAQRNALGTSPLRLLKRFITRGSRCLEGAPDAGRQRCRAPGSMTNEVSGALRSVPGMQLATQALTASAGARRDWSGPHRLWIPLHHPGRALLLRPGAAGNGQRERRGSTVQLLLLAWRGARC